MADETPDVNGATTPDPDANDLDLVTQVEGANSNEQVAMECLAGKWGRGNDRKQRLEKAGYNPAAINNEINKIRNPE
jgi:hypothetical protein